MLTTWLSRLFLESVVPVIPGKWKRLLYISSILGLTSFIRKPDVVILEKLNSILQMTERAHSYLIPIFIRNLIWSSVMDSKIPGTARDIRVLGMNPAEMNELELAQVSLYLASRAPMMLKYGSPELMARDGFLCLKKMMEPGTPEAVAA